MGRGSPRRGPGALRVLGPLRLRLWSVVAVVEVGLVLAYRGLGARSPWSTHVFMGASLALVAMALAVCRWRQPVGDEDRRSGTTLHVRRWGEGRPVLFLHGLGASSHYWDALATRTSGYEAIAPDLLGFGRSPKPRHAAYDVEGHLQALQPLLRPGTIVVGHSAGAMLAAALAAAPPLPLAGVILIGLTAYPDVHTARREIGRLGLLARLTVNRNPVGWLVCTLMCILRPLAVLVGPLLIRDLPPAVVADGARHTWRSYSRTLHRVVVDHRSAPDLAAASVEVCLMHGTADREAPIAYAREAAGAAAQAGGRVSFEEVDGDHHIAVRAPEPVAAVLQAFLARPTTKTDPPSHHLS